MSPNDPSDAIERKQTIAGFFDRASNTYDHVGPKFFSYFGRKLVEHAALPRDARVLDVATGRGAVFFPAAEAVGSNGFVTGIDFSEGMVQETAREVAQRGLSNAEVRRMDAEHLDFPDASFAVILCGLGIFFFPQAELALAEFHRTLKPGGQLALTTWGDQFDRRWDWFGNLVIKYLPPQPRAAQPPAASTAPNFGTSGGMEKIIGAAGFREIRVISEIVEFTYATQEEWWESLWSHAARPTLERIESTGGPEKLIQFKAECFEQMGTGIDSGGFPRSYHVLYTLAQKPF